ncbi:uncharacterized protein PAC_10568 [Phialocephala subalpina]|uniref:Uncharacterized protein n=1 Tax=Phialocephala subalpina TaxID=576137 RepID=A0A1L7X6N8_9HELO|nr:uncharacterized protein PAC_10568 [Phialocephala subalpina]
MLRNRCKLYVGSDGPRNSPPLNFLSLPREIRDEIYELALVSTSPIIVWKGHWKYHPSYEIPGPEFNADGSWTGPHLCINVRWRWTDEEAISASLRALDLNIIFCNKTVSHEAAQVFYAKNTFSFMGWHNWDLIVSWLEAIGPTNRNSLVSMEISAYRPDPAWQRSSGERIKEPSGFTMEDVYPRHPYLQLPTTEDRLPCGRVDNINPSVETIFVLLGQKTSEQKATIVMRLPGFSYPGARSPRTRDDCCPENGWYSMDLPNLIEKSRSLHAQQVEVLWKGEDCRKELEDQQEIMEGIGWQVNVLPAAEDELHPNPEYHGCHPTMDEWRIAKYVLRRKKLTEPLCAEDPCPHSHVSLDDSRYN